MKKLINKPLKGDELMKLVKNKSSIYTYPDLKDCDSIDEVLYPHNSAIILYETKKNYGHWCCIIKRGDTIEFFDSYGIFPDEELYFVSKNFRISNKMKKPHLSYLLDKSKYKIEYNNHKLQSKKKGTNTCGRWVGYRILNKHMNIDDFSKGFLNNKYLTPDELISLKTFYI